MAKAAELFLRLFDYLRVCVNCSSATYSELYCRVCWREHLVPLMVSSDDIRFGHDLNGKQTFSLFWWSEESALETRELVMSLKGGLPIRFLETLAEEFCVRRSSRGFVKNLLIVPAPAKTKGEFDHAYRWAEALSKVWGGELYNGLERISDQSQKSLSVQDRNQIRFNRDESRTLQGIHSHHVVFADDVVTSGATAHAAYEALGRPPHFEVWSVACRPKLFLV